MSQHEWILQTQCCVQKKQFPGDHSMYSFTFYKIQKQQKLNVILEYDIFLRRIKNTKFKTVDILRKEERDEWMK